MGMKMLLGSPGLRREGGAATGGESPGARLCLRFLSFLPTALSLAPDDTLLENRKVYHSFFHNLFLSEGDFKKHFLKFQIL